MKNIIIKITKMGITVCKIHRIKKNISSPNVTHLVFVFCRKNIFIKLSIPTEESLFVFRIYISWCLIHLASETFLFNFIEASFDFCCDVWLTKECYLFLQNYRLSKWAFAFQNLKNLFSFSFSCFSKDINGKTYNAHFRPRITK